jgi:hypothetical protein
VRLTEGQEWCIWIVQLSGEQFSVDISGWIGELSCFYVDYGLLGMGI